MGSPALAGFAYEANKPHLGGDVTPLEAFEMVKKDPEHTFLVDCRTRAEYQFVGHPEGACNEAIKAGWAEDKVFNMMGGFEGGKNKDSLFYGQRWDGGWQREGLPWTYSMDTALMYKPDVDKMTSNLGGGRLRVASK